MEISDFFPHIQTLADDICVIRSMVTTPCQTELIEAINQLNQDHAIENPVHVRDLHATMLLQSLSRPRQGL